MLTPSSGVVRYLGSSGRMGMRECLEGKHGKEDERLEKGPGRRLLRCRTT